MPPHRWKKGESGNPKGKPPGSISLVSLLKKKLQDIPPGQKKTYAELFIQRYMTDALKGKSDLLKDAFDRIDGKSKQVTELTGEDGGPVAFSLTRIHERAKARRAAARGSDVG